MPLSNKTIVLTGAQGGIGQALLTRLSQYTTEVIAIGRKPEDNIIQADLADSDNIESLCKLLNKKPVDILINLAGLMYFGDTTKLSMDKLNEIVQVNLTTPMLLTQAVLPNMLKRGQGHIVNIGSIFGSLPFPSFSAYSATKAGLKGFSDSIRREYSALGLHVSHVSPRAVHTAFNTQEINLFHQLTNANIDSPEIVADIILNAIIKKKRNINIGFYENFFVHVNALMPSIVDKALISKQTIANEVLLGDLS
jgi:short-subunit dehydrogenase